MAEPPSLAPTPNKFMGQFYIQVFYVQVGLVVRGEIYVFFFRIFREANLSSDALLHLRHLPFRQKAKLSHEFVCLPI